ncbi:hypothetical protein [Brevibacillus sp. BC25]|uniref:hypothetical protein n=1 Tax=Brevibacillus sp. BC25 TaxID=1144308 RepID=UPI000271297E|nr:hypothetical protein [Brevibacillus sp. BC25]EJL25002.1 hypothetical protein PMI05_04024 [Brevibacillus sp. BC25]
MAGMQCKCGKILSNTSSPNEVQLRVYSDLEYEEILGLSSIRDIFPPKNDVWRCNNCERIYVFDEEDNLLKTYVLEID